MIDGAFWSKVTRASTQARTGHGLPPALLRYSVATERCEASKDESQIGPGRKSPLAVRKNNMTSAASGSPTKVR